MRAAAQRWQIDRKSVRKWVSLTMRRVTTATSARRFSWCIENRAADIMQPDLHSYGGFIRSTRVARMAAAAGMKVVPHMSGGSLG